MPRWKEGTKEFNVAVNRDDSREISAVFLLLSCASSKTLRR
jgi:hypothetical protein